jgi:8-oxo-dGTP pyrophosphatase MutT (NUDIX family)
MSLLHLYTKRFPDETGRTALFEGYLADNDSQGLIDRKNFSGHITTSAFIVDPDTAEMLLLRHKSLNRWLQPGGHVEGSDVSLNESALREAMEETGIAADQLLYLPIHDIADVPFDIDSHYIPANPRKSEEGHYHHDWRYVFGFTGSREHSYNKNEATGMKWVSFSDLADDETFGLMVRKIASHIKR